jgi:hypothetical protein
MLIRDGIDLAFGTALNWTDYIVIHLAVSAVIFIHIFISSLQPP